MADLRQENLILMQDGAGVRQMLEEAMRRAGTRLRDLDVRIELRAADGSSMPCAPGSASRSSRGTSVEADLAAGALVEARVAGLELEREILLVRATGRTETRAARAFVDFARETLP